MRSSHSIHCNQQQQPHVLLLLLPVLLLLLAAVDVRAAQAGGEGWRTGRVTYYGAPESFARAYDPTRGAGSFGILAYGSCGYTNAGGTLAVPRDEAAASADGSADFPGSCGGCYDIRCTTGSVLDNSGSPIKIINGYYGGDRWRPYLPAINPNIPDSQGRKFPGNAGNSTGTQITQCHQEGQTLRIRITDSCPCSQQLKAGAPGVSEDTTRTQEWCCSSNVLEHFDISYYAFEQLAHPVFGVAMIQFRPVDCDTGAPLPFKPGYIDRQFIYSGGARTGWSWYPYTSSDFQLSVPSARSPSGEASTCLNISPGGGLQFKCRECYKEGYQPFAKPSPATAISFNIRSNAKSADPYESSTPSGAKPNLKLILQKSETGNYCAGEPQTGKLSAQNSTGGWYKFDVPMSDFDCPGGGISLSDVDQFEFQNPNERNADVCIADIEIRR